jgi:hypothetical protein
VEVWVDGRQIARETPLRYHRLPAGTHKLTLVYPPTGKKWTRTVQVQANRELSVFADTQSGEIRTR